MIGVSVQEVNITTSVRQHFADIGHDEAVHDVTYENCQARERTQVLMDIANQSGGLVIGTGDLSELALGWATYNGDHMSMYAVNCSVPKTLVRYIVRYEADSSEPVLRDILLDIPVYWTLPSGEIFVLASVVTSLATFYVAQKYPPPMGTIRVADAIVLALFGMIGTEKSYLHGYTPTVSVMMGICTGVAGGLLRDVLTGNVPYVFRPGELYATAALLGGVAYAVLYYAGIDSSTCFVTGFMVTLSVRLAAIRWNWNLPSYIPLFTSDTDSPPEEPET